METLEILFITLPVIVLLAAVGIFFSTKKDQEYTINVTLHDVDELIDPPVAEPVVKPKRRYKRRKKKVVTTSTTTTAAPTVAPKKRVGRPRKTN